MKYVVLGAPGQLGRDLCPRLTGPVIPLSHADADLTQAETLRTILAGHEPDVVINCAAYNFVDQAEKEPPNAFAVNAWGVRNLALACRELNCTLVHVSTDYVFGLDAERTIPYPEDASPGPISVYGLSKLTGEYLVRALCPRHFVVRTCGLYGVWGSGGKGRNFVETMLRVAGEGKPLKVVADQVCTPSFTVDVARGIAALVPTARYGLYHLTNEGATSWYEFAQAIFELAGVKADLAPTTSNEYVLPARRPAYSVLENRALREAGLPALRPWREALAAYLEERRRKIANA